MVLFLVATLAAAVTSAEAGTDADGDERGFLERNRAAYDAPGCRTDGPWSRGHLLLRPAIGFTDEQQGADKPVKAVVQLSGGVLRRMLRCHGSEEGSIWSYDLESTISYGLAFRSSVRQTVGLGVAPSVDSVWATLGVTADVLVARQAGEAAFGVGLGGFMKGFAGLVVLQGRADLFPRDGFANQFVVTVGTDIQLLGSAFGPSFL